MSVSLWDMNDHRWVSLVLLHCSIKMTLLSRSQSKHKRVATWRIWFVLGSYTKCWFPRIPRFVGVKGTRWNWAHNFTVTGEKDDRRTLVSFWHIEAHFSTTRSNILSPRQLEVLKQTHQNLHRAERNVPVMISITCSPLRPRWSRRHISRPKVECSRACFVSMHSGLAILRIWIKLDYIAWRIVIAYLSRCIGW